VLEVGDRIPDVKVWLAPRESTSLRELVGEGSVLVLFYLFDWSKSQGERERLPRTRKGAHSFR
jgi:peroxiredoxin